jgi:hypothetical protein
MHGWSIEDAAWAEWAPAPGKTLKGWVEGYQWEPTLCCGLVHVGCHVRYHFSVGGLGIWALHHMCESGAC